MLAVYIDDGPESFHNSRAWRPARRVRNSARSLGANDDVVEEKVKSAAVGVIVGVAALFALVIAAAQSSRRD